MRKCAEAKLADIETRIEALQRMKKALQTITSACPGEGPIEECPILAAIDSDKAELPTTEARTSKSETSGRARERGARARASVRSRR